MKKYLIYIVLVGFGISCQDVVDLDLPVREASLVAVGRVTDSADTYVNLSVTAGYLEQGQTPRISGATVLLFENGTMVSQFQEDSAGYYTSNFRGNIGNSYEIEIQIPAGNPSLKAGTWRSLPETMRRVLRLDSFNIRELDRNTQPQVFTEGPYALTYFQEPSGKGDSYRFRFWKNDSL